MNVRLAQRRSFHPRLPHELTQTGFCLCKNSEDAAFPFQVEALEDESTIEDRGRRLSGGPAEECRKLGSFGAMDGSFHANATV